MVRSLIAGTLATLLTSGVAQAQHTREVSVTPRSLVEVHTKLRFTTLIILPDGEEILDFVCGDKDMWVVSGAQNMAYVKPAKAGVATNLNLVTASGHVYSFVLTEGSADPDLKIYVSSEQVSTPTPTPPKFVSAAQADALRQEVENAHRAVQVAQASAADAIETAHASAAAATAAIDERVGAFRATYPTTLEFPYHFRLNTHPFYVTAIFHDDRFTYIRATPTELPSLYEVLDGKPNLVNFQVDHGTYIVPKVLQRGYLIIGARTLAFDVKVTRETR